MPNSTFTPMFEIKYRLMAPGPVQLSPKVQAALSEPMVHHRTPQFTKALNFVLKQLPGYFQTKQPVVMLSSTGSGAMEAAVTNLVSPGDKVVVIQSGKFGERWADMAEAFGAIVIRHKVTWGEAVCVKDIDELLNQNPDIKICFSQACETSTGTNHPIKNLAEVCKNHNVLFAVDAITAVAAIDLKMDDWGIDALVAGSQKAFMLPAGLSFVCLSKKAWQQQKTSTTPKYYWNLLKELNANAKGQTYFSSNVSLILALKTVIEEWDAAGGIDARVARTSTLSAATQAGVKQLGLTLYSKQPATTVTAINTPSSIDGAKLRAHIEEKYQVTLMGGQDQLKGKIIRIGHMGHITNDDVLATIYFIGQALKDFDFDLTDDTINKAVDAAKTILEV